VEGIFFIIISIYFSPLRYQEPETVSVASFCILWPPLLVVQTVFGRVDGFVTKLDSFWHSESVDCVDYTRSSIGTHSTTPREGLKSPNQLEAE
jgi:hypothetical protein